MKQKLSHTGPPVVVWAEPVSKTTVAVNAATRGLDGKEARIVCRPFRVFRSVDKLAYPVFGAACAIARWLRLMGRIESPLLYEAVCDACQSPGQGWKLTGAK